MKRKKYKTIQFISLALIVVLFNSCKKEEGVGGSAIVYGTVYEIELSPNTGDTISTYLALDQDIYIIYGDDIVYNDKTSTSLNGMFRFEYLYPGDYTVFAYTDCNNCDSGKEPITFEFTLSKNEEKSLGEIFIKKY